MTNFNVSGYKPSSQFTTPNNNSGQGVTPSSTNNNAAPDYSAAAYQGGFPKPSAR